MTCGRNRRSRATAFSSRIRPTGESRKRRAGSGILYQLRRAFLGYGRNHGYSRLLPWALGAFGSRFIAVLNTIVVVGLADRAQSFVVQARQAKAFLQFLGKLLQGFQMVRRGGDFILGSLQKLLVAAVHEFGNFAADHVAGIGENLYSVDAVFLDGGGTTVLLQEHTSLGSRSFDQVKTVLTQPVQGFVIGPMFCCGCHFFLCS